MPEMEAVDLLVTHRLPSEEQDGPNCACEEANDESAEGNAHCCTRRQSVAAVGRSTWTQVSEA